LSPGPSVSGSGSSEPNSQNPAESRELLGPYLDVWGTSSQPQTQWRWGESEGNSSLVSDPCSVEKMQGNPSKLGSPGVIWATVSKPFRSRSDGFPMTMNRRFNSMTCTLMVGCPESAGPSATESVSSRACAKRRKWANP
jgi:hypothetical protein